MRRHLVSLSEFEYHQLSLFNPALLVWVRFEVSEDVGYAMHAKIIAI
jgi:hypothetical protein